MDWPYVHLLINHFPVILSVMGAAGAIAAIVMHRRGLWLYAVASMTLAGLSIYPVFLTGHEADETFDRLHPWFIVRGTIHAHEEFAELTLWVTLIAGLIAAYAWWRAVRRDEAKPPAWLRALVTIAALAAAGCIGWSSLLGGKIVHKSTILEAPHPPTLEQVQQNQGHRPPPPPPPDHE